MVRFYGITMFGNASGTKKVLFKSMEVEDLSGRACIDIVEKDPT